MKNALSLTIIAATSLFAGAASASTQENVALCASEIDDRGIASISDYRPKFKKSRGGGLKKVTLMMIPTSDGKAPIEVVCSVKRGKIVDVAVKN